MTASLFVGLRRLTPQLSAVLVTVAVIKTVVAFGCLALLLARDVASVPFWVFPLVVLAFGVTGLWLCINARDTRTRHLGVTYTLIGVAFCEPLLSAFDTSGQGPSAVVRFLLALSPEAFIPYYFTLFALASRQEYVAYWRSRAAEWFTVLVFAVSLALCLPNVAALFFDRARLPAAARALLEPDADAIGYFWLVLVAAILPAVLSALFGRAGPREHNRLRVFRVGILLGLAPLLVTIVLMQASPDLDRLFQEPPYVLPLSILIYGGLLSVPIMTGYAVVAHRVFDVPLVIRQTIRYALARYSIIAMSVVPLLLLAFYVYQRRAEPLADILGSVQPLMMVGLTAFGFVVFRFRQFALRAIDRRFFRDHYEGTIKLASVLKEVATPAGRSGVYSAIEHDLADALGTPSVCVLKLATDQGMFCCGSPVVRPLPAGSALIPLVRSSADGFEIYPEESSRVYQQLPLDDREWLADTGMRLLVPIEEAGRGTLGGFIAATEKYSELPFSREERTLLAAIAPHLAPSPAAEIPSSTGPAIEVDSDSGPAPATLPAPCPTPGTLVEAARCCEECWQVLPGNGEVCLDCGSPTGPMTIPYFLHGKFRLMRRLGAGGMGIVYLAQDLDLERLVAIKTLPRLEPERVLRLRREARAVAAVTHPNLAAIYAEESWHGVPLLVFEYMGGGTLADRVHGQGMPVADVLGVGVSVCSALDYIHERQITHRDIKPSNIGFTEDGVAKLMDFGLARHTTQPFMPGRYGKLVPADEDAVTVDSTTFGSVRHLAGTPGYLSPEALRGDLPDAHVDMWALAMTLYKSITGHLPGEAWHVGTVVGRVFSDRDLRKLEERCTPSVCDFFERALARKRSRRHADAAAMGAELEQCLQMLPPGEGAQP